MSDQASPATPSTEAGRRHVEWLLGAHIPTFDGELYRSNFTASVLAIEAEARDAGAPGLREALEGALNWTSSGQWAHVHRDDLDAIAARLAPAADAIRLREALEEVMNAECAVGARGWCQCHPWPKARAIFAGSESVAPAPRETAAAPALDVDDLADTFCFLRRHDHDGLPACRSSLDEAAAVVRAIGARRAARLSAAVDADQ